MCCVVLDRVVAELDSLVARIGGRFTRPEPRGRAREYMSGLMSGLERKNGWTQAERAGEGSPDGMQRLLRKADWDVDGVRDDVRTYVHESGPIAGGERAVRVGGRAGDPGPVVEHEQTTRGRLGARCHDRGWAEGNDQRFDVAGGAGSHGLGGVGGVFVVGFFHAWTAVIHSSHTAQ
jgi:hypothetical protein